VIVAVVTAETAVVLTVNVAEILPAAIVTVDGTVALVLLEDNETTIPPEPASVLTATVPIEGDPPWTEVGAKLKPLSPVGVTVSAVVIVSTPKDAVMVAVDVVDTEEVDIVKVSVVAPPGINKLLGTVTPVELDERLTVIPPGCDGWASVTGPTDD
jgi:hypothetical protein